MVIITDNNLDTIIHQLDDPDLGLDLQIGVGKGADKIVDTEMIMV